MPISLRSSAKRQACAAAVLLGSILLLGAGGATPPARTPIEVRVTATGDERSCGPADSLFDEGLRLAIASPSFEVVRRGREGAAMRTTVINLFYPPDDSTRRAVRVDVTLEHDLDVGTPTGHTGSCVSRHYALQMRIAGAPDTIRSGFVVRADRSDCSSIGNATGLLVLEALHRRLHAIRRFERVYLGEGARADSTVMGIVRIE